MKTLESEMIVLQRNVVKDELLIEVRRSNILEDALRECRKKKFDPAKTLKVILPYA